MIRRKIKPSDLKKKTEKELIEILWRQKKKKISRDASGKRSCNRRIKKRGLDKFIFSWR